MKDLDNLWDRDRQNEREWDIKRETMKESERKDERYEEIMKLK